MIDFVLQEEKKGLQNTDRHLRFEKILKYANFLKQTLTLGMFVPCVDNEPFNYSKHGNAEQYEKAKEKVLFKGFKKDFNSVIGPDGYLDISKLQGKNIEDIIGSNLQLTENALKKIGL